MLSIIPYTQGGNRNPLSALDLWARKILGFPFTRTPISPMIPVERESMTPTKANPKRECGRASGARQSPLAVHAPRCEVRPFVSELSRLDPPAPELEDMP